MSEPADASHAKNLSFARRAWCLLQYLALRLAIAFVLGLPDFLARGLVRLGARLAYRLDWKHPARAEEHLRSAGWSARRAHVIGRRMYEHFAVSFWESLLLRRRLNPATWTRYVRLENWDLLETEVASKRGAICVGCHEGNWELAGVVSTAVGMPLTTVARSFGNPYIDDYLNAGLRQEKGRKTVVQTGAIRQLFRDLREGRLAVLLADQNAGRDGVFVPFFGRPASTVGTPALLHIKTGASILPFYTYREAPFRYVFGFHSDPSPALTGKNEQDVLAITAWYTAIFERSIRSHPEQWLWAHRRWRSLPGEGKAERAAKAGAGTGGGA